MTLGLLAVGLPLLGLSGCDTAETTEPVVEEGITLLTPREQLIRLSVDLRGVHPSETELEAIEANPDLYVEFADRYLEDDRFLDRVEEIFNHHYRTRTGDTYFDVEEAGLGVVGESRVADSIADEPLKLIRHIVDHDLPWSQVVTADYTMSDPLLAAMWDLDYPEDGSGWQQAWYKDGREHAGVLSMTTMWLRYPSAGVNGNRHRANTISRVLLCDDYLARPVSFSRSQIDALTSGDPEDVIRDTPTCQSCHSSLDPLAAHFFGFWWEIEGDLDDQTLYRPEDEELWRDYSGREPGYFGLPTANLRELGDQLAEDPRFVDCAVQQVFEGITQRDLSDLDWEEVSVHRDAFADSGLMVRALVRSIVNSDRYRAAATADEALGERLSTVKTVSPSQLSSIIEGKTGYKWTFDGRDALVRNELGLAVLGGGIDSRYVTTPNYEPSVGLVFIQERLSQNAARYVVDHDLDPERADDAILLQYVTIEDRPETSADAFEAQIRDLYLQVTGLPLDNEATEPAALTTLWKEVYSVEGDAETAWAGVLSVVLRDPRILFY
ncbi:MAG: DUF1585 domain-containing protein [Alphaproteobacteria bacterium]|nr:DUF1585 domain-containing protein [Alphaproteobacteria bacterium]